jgi:hypothetical protein
MLRNYLARPWAKWRNEINDPCPCGDEHVRGICGEHQSRIPRWLVFLARVLVRWAWLKLARQILISQPQANLPFAPACGRAMGKLVSAPESPVAFPHPILPLQL